jgi:hypothetical protein
MLLLAWATYGVLAVLNSRPPRPPKLFGHRGLADLNCSVDPFLHKYLHQILSPTPPPRRTRAPEIALGSFRFLGLQAVT